ncbi:MAG: hypothetical protein ACLFO6_08680 [Archaeoglobaceae archaeon]
MAICPYCRKDIGYLNLIGYDAKERKVVVYFNAVGFSPIDSALKVMEYPKMSDKVEHYSYDCPWCDNSLFREKKDAVRFMKNGYLTEDLYPQVIARAFDD